jgi:hypothetical protein
MVGNLRRAVSGQESAAQAALSVRRIGRSFVKRIACADTAAAGTPIVRGLILSFLFLFAALTAHAALQFDVFLGYDGVVPEASWFPVTCEIKNDGPSFKGTVEITPDYGQGQTRREQVELPTGTLKRVFIPVFCNAGYSTWNIRLIDERGKVRAEKLKEQALRQVSAGTPIMGAIMRNAGAKPLIRPVATEQEKPQPPAAAVLPPILPDNPLILEGMTALYLSSMRAPELRDPDQVQALYAWLNAGGHLIVGVEQISDVTSVKWLDALFPIELHDIRPVAQHTELHAWIQTVHWDLKPVQPNYPYSMSPPRTRPPRRPRNQQVVPAPAVEESSSESATEIADDPKFEAAPLQVALGKLRDGKVVVPQRSSDGPPLIVSAPRGRGRITVLLFSPEREPFVQWKNLPVFWAKVTDIPANWYVRQQVGGWSSDAIFGAMTDSRQVHKLPVEWLLVLLIVYLIVIGPFDRFWLKKINRPMLTWITFPCYVVAFSLVIYFIGYKLRAGEAEWNELHIVDVLQNGDKAELRGRTYASIYSPANERYKVESAQKYATLRGEFSGAQGSAQSGEKGTVDQNGDSFKGEIFIPVWTSQLFISDWWEPTDIPLSATVAKQGNGWRVTVENHTEQKISDARIVVDNLIFTLGEIPGSQSKTFALNSEQGLEVRTYVSSHSDELMQAARSRQNAFGAAESGHLNDLPNATITASFLSQMSRQEVYMGNFVTAPGLDLAYETERGNAILFAWAENYSPVKALYQIQPKRAHKNTMFRIPIRPS